MLNSLKIENYKSFKSADFNFTNLTFLVGGNSCGKSSITNLLLLLSQSLDSSFDFDTILRLNGKNIGLGDDINILRNHDENNDVTISWSVASDNDVFNELTEEDLLEDFYHNFLFNHSVIRKIYSKTSFNHFYEKSNLLMSKTETDYYRIIESFASGKLINILSQQQTLLKKIKSNDDGIEPTLKEKLRVHVTARLKDLLNFVRVRSYNEMQPNNITLKLRYNASLGELELKDHSIKNIDGKEIIGFYFNPNKRIDIRSDIFDENVLKKSRTDIIKKLNANSILLVDKPVNSMSLSSSDNPFAAYCLMYVSATTRFLCRQFINGKIYHVSPLRALPQRYYLLEKSAHHKAIDSYSGTEVLEVLKNNTKVLAAVNDFFKEFNISIKPVKVKDVIHKLSIQQDGIDVDLTDVGFGISQVLPILVQLLLCENGSIIIIEQPEIHLHPNMQAILTSWFAKIAEDFDKKLIIETHSEAMIRRLQRLYLDPSNNLTNDDVRVYQFTRHEDGSSEVACDTLGPLGEVKWMKGFKDIEIEDTLEIQKLRSNKLSRGNNVN